jgi:hypothetical protein
MQEIRKFVPKIRARELTPLLLPYSGAIRQAAPFQDTIRVVHAAFQQAEGVPHHIKDRPIRTATLTVALSNFASAITEPR